MFGRLAEIIPAYEEYVAKLKVRYENGVNARHPPLDEGAFVPLLRYRPVMRWSLQAIMFEER